MTSCTEGSVTVTCDANNSSLKLVEMCSEGVWSPVCDHDWTLQDATVFCKELGFSFLGIYYCSCILHNRCSVVDTGEMIAVDSRSSETISVYTYQESCDYLLVDCRGPLPPVITPSDPTGTIILDTTTGEIILRETPAVRVSNTPQPKANDKVATEQLSPGEGAGVPAAVIAAAVVGGVAVALVLLLSMSLLILLRNHKLKR